MFYFNQNSLKEKMRNNGVFPTGLRFGVHNFAFLFSLCYTYFVQHLLRLCAVCWKRLTCGLILVTYPHSQWPNSSFSRNLNKVHSSWRNFTDIFTSIWHFSCYSSSYSLLSSHIRLRRLQLLRQVYEERVKKRRKLPGLCSCHFILPLESHKRDTFCWLLRISAASLLRKIAVSRKACRITSVVWQLRLAVVYSRRF